MTITKEQIEQAKHDFENESELYWHKDTKEIISQCLSLSQKVISKPSEGMMAQKGLLEIIDSQRQTFNALMKKYEDAEQLLKDAQYNLHMCNGVFVPSNDKANKYIADLCRQIEEFLNE